MAEAAIPLRKKLGTEAEAFRGSKERLAKTVALLEQKEQEGRDKIQGLKLGLEEIEAKSVALEFDEGSVEALGGDGGPRLRHRRETGA